MSHRLFTRRQKAAKRGPRDVDLNSRKHCSMPSKSSRDIGLTGMQPRYPGRGSEADFLAGNAGRRITSRVGSGRQPWQITNLRVSEMSAARSAASRRAHHSLECGSTSDAAVASWSGSATVSAFACLFALCSVAGTLSIRRTTQTVPSDRLSGYGVAARRGTTCQGDGRQG